MKLIIDTDEKTLVLEEGDQASTLPLYGKEAFEEISRQWVRVGWNQKYQYTFSWMGRPVIQLPEDMIRVQEAIYQVKPDVIIETGIAHGGSLIFYASLCKAMEQGRIIGIDIDIRAHNRKAIEAHELSNYITMFEGSSIDENLVSKVQSELDQSDTVLVILDSNHTRDHVKRELELYSPMVSKGSYIVATDGIMFDLNDVPRGADDWTADNPVEAVKDFLAENGNFTLEQPEWPFNESNLDRNITHWPDAWLKRS